MDAEHRVRRRGQGKRNILKRCEMRSGTSGTSQGSSGQVEPENRSQSACNLQIIGEAREIKSKKRGRPPRRAPSWLKVKLEGKQDREPRTERIDKALVLEGGRGNRLLEILVHQTESKVPELIDRCLTSGVHDVEEVERDPELHPFS